MIMFNSSSSSCCCCCCCSVAVSAIVMMYYNVYINYMYVCVYSYNYVYS